MYLCNRKNKRMKCKYHSLVKFEDEKIKDHLCLQYHDIQWNKCKCQRAHTKEV